MYTIELIRVADGYWAAHCEDEGRGSLARSRVAAIEAISEALAQNGAPEHPAFDDSGNKIYPLPEPGYYSF